MRSTIPALILSLAFLHLDVVIGEQQPPPAATAPGEQPPVTFKVEVNYVEIDATVTDANGNFVRGLTKDDFEIIEQSKPQTISIFSLVDLPVEPSDPPLYAKAPIDPDVRSNAREFDGRVFILVLDDYHTSFQRTPRLRAGRAPVRRTLPRRQRSCRDRHDERLPGRRPELHDQSRAAPEGD